MVGPRADAHLTEVGEKEGVREAQSWLDLALSLLSLGEEEEALAAYDRAFTLDPARARQFAVPARCSGSSPPPRASRSRTTRATRVRRAPRPPAARTRPPEPATDPRSRSHRSAIGRSG